MIPPIGGIRVVKITGTGSRMGGCRGWGGGEWELLGNRHRVSDRPAETVLGMDGDDSAAM